MAPSKRRGPLTLRGAGGGPQIEQLGGGLDHQNTGHSFDPQEFRAAIFGRRFRLAPDMAQVVAGLALGEVRA